MLLDPDGPEFQSRNRESYLFKSERKGFFPVNLFVFQSRNRESYLFKSAVNFAETSAPPSFQSRNRESYLFKGGLPEALLYVPESEAFL